MKLYQVTTRYFVAGVIVDQGKVIRAAPILGWAIGKPTRQLAEWVKRKWGTVVLVSEVEE